MIEIERKFLVKSSLFKAKAYDEIKIVQGFLNTDPERTVRVRISGETAYLTIKGSSSPDGVSRFEWEKEISVKDASRLMELCEPGIIQKVRYLVKMNSHIFEVDEFAGDNEGLILAELELKSEKEKYEKPEWLGKEVTGDIRYYNSYLSKNPYRKNIKK